MHRLRLLLVVFTLVVLCGAWAEGQDKAGKQKGTLPQNWGKLGLSDEQKQKIYRIQNDYRSKIEDVQKQLDDLRERQRRDMETVLSDAQKTQLRQILAGKAPPDDKKGKDK